MKIATIVGARPQFIKAAAVSKHLRAVAEERLIHTGQHYDAAMSQVFFDELGIPAPDHHLGVGSGLHGAQTGAMLERLEPILLAEKPDAVLVYGDTNSTLAGALVASKLHIPVAHVEAGLRSFDRRMPEEVNRVLTDHVATWLFCPTETARDNLAKEGITSGVEVVGDVMHDLLLQRLGPARANYALLDQLGIKPGAYALATLHRAENTDEPARLARIVGALDKLADEHMPVVFPVHPRTAKAFGDRGLLPRHVRSIAPQAYDDMLTLLAHARVVLTDSGGLQKEAMWAGVPCVTLRDATEWVETVDAGWNVLAGSDPERIVAAAVAARAPRRSPNQPSDVAKAIVRSLCEGSTTL